MSSGAYESVVGDREASVGTFREFVVYKEQQMYPQYLILYSHELEEQPSSLSGEAPVLARTLPVEPQLHPACAKTFSSDPGPAVLRKDGTNSFEALDAPDTSSSDDGPDTSAPDTHASHGNSMSALPMETLASGP